MLPAAIILYCLGALLGGWGASLVWRAARVRMMRRHGRGSFELTSRQRRLVLVAGILGPPIGGACIVAGEFIRGGFRFPLYRDPAFYYGLGVVLCLMLALGAMFAGWRFDPARGRRRCRRCWYDMVGAPSLTCPECGRIARHERDLRRTRRSRALMALGMVFVLAAYGVHVAPRVRKDGWLAAVPTTVLIAGLPWWPEEWVTEGDGSLRERDIDWAWQKDLLRWRCRRIIERSADLSLLCRAAACFRSVYWGEAYPPLSLAALVKLYGDYCSPDANVADEAEEMVDVKLSRHIPETFDIVATAAIVPIVDSALDDPSEDRIRRARNAVFHLDGNAASLAPKLAVLAREYVSPLDARVHDSRGAWATGAIVHLATMDDSAWQTYLSLLDDPNEDVQRYAIVAINFGGALRERSNDLLPRWVRISNSQGDWLAGLGAKYVLKYGPEPCRYSAQFIERAGRSDEFALKIVPELADKCSAQASIAILQRLLASADRQTRMEAVWASGNLGADAESLLPILRAVRDSTSGSEDASSVSAVIGVIEKAVDELKKGVP